MRFKNDNDNKYRVNFMRATEALIDKTTVAEFIEHLENNAELEDESTHIYIDGKTIWCKDYVLKETDKLRKEFLVSEDGSRLFYAISVTKRAELVDDSTEAAADNTEAINRKERRTMASEERRTISTEELIKELGSAVWNYGAAGRDNIIKKYGVEAYEAAQTAIHEEVRDKRRGRIMCIVSVLALISALANLLLPIFLK